jgi:HSP20 family protein
MLHRIHPADPFRTMELFFDAMRAPGLRRGTTANRAIRQPGLAQLREEDEHFVLSAELPGVSPDKLELAAGDDWIELRASREVAVPEGFELLRRERADYQFNRRFALPKRIVSDKVEATLRDGLLTVTLPKHASAGPRTIEVKAA